MNHFSAPDIDFHPDMPAAELVGRWLYLLEKTGMPNWPLDVLPLLRVRYGGLLKASLLSVTIQSDNAAMGEFELQTADMTAGVMPAMRFSSEHSDMQPVIAGLMERCDDFNFVREIGLFDEQALSFMARMSQCQVMEDELDKLQGAAHHYLRCARILARHIVRNTDLEGATIALLKSSLATGIADDEARAHTLWDELVDGSASNSILSELWHDEVSSAVDDVFDNQQSFAVQLAFWMDSDYTAQDIENCECDGAPGKNEDFGLRDLNDTHLITQEVVKNVIGMAMNAAVEKSTDW